MMLENDRLSWFNVIQSYLMSYTKIKRIVACFVRSVETSPVYQININPSPVNGNEKLSVLNKNKEIESPKGSLVERAWFHVRSLSCLQSFVWWGGLCIFWKKSLVCQRKLAEWGRSSGLQGYQDGVEIYEGWTLEVIKVYFPFCQEFFSSHTENLPRFLKRHFSVLTGTKVSFLLLYYQN